LTIFEQRNGQYVTMLLMTIIMTTTMTIDEVGRHTYAEGFLFLHCPLSALPVHNADS